MVITQGGVVTGDPTLDVGDALALAPGSWQAPHPRPGLIDRVSVVASLVDADAPLVVVTAPAGYGKTTSMLLWDQADARPFAWVNLDRLDDDPVHLVRHIGGALGAITPLDPTTHRLLAGPGRDPEAELLPAVANLLVRRGPAVVVLDDVHLVTGERSRRCLERLADAVPGGSTIALVGRTAPAIRIARRRMDDAVVEVDAAALALSNEEAHRLFDAMEVRLSPSAIDELVERTEGWPGGLHLAGLGFARRAPEGAPANAFSGRDRLVVDYLMEEVLDALDPDLAEFLERSAILEHMSAPLLDALLETDTSGKRLHEIEQSGNLFLVPLDTDRVWYRYHHLFGELLRARLSERDPRTSVELHRRASDLLERAGDDDGAIEHAVAAGDLDRALGIIMAEAPRLVLGGRVGVLARWLDRLDDRTAATAIGSLARAWLGIGIGDVAEAHAASTAALELGADETLPDGVTTVAVAVACLRSIVAPDGLTGIIDDTDLVVREGNEAMRPWWSTAIAVRATALSMMGEVEEAARLLRACRPGVADLPAFAAAAEAHLALLALERDDLVTAEAHVRAARRVRERHDFEGLTAATIVFATDALVSARLGNRSDALREAAIAGELLARLDDVVPRSALIGHVVVARACLLIDDRAGAQHHVQQADRAREREPHATKTIAQLDAIHELLDAANRKVAGGPALTAAELRVLPYLTTHLSLKEIAGELIISRNTAKSHAVAIYRKLGATSRSEAVARATELGLLQP